MDNIIPIKQFRFLVEGEDFDSFAVRSCSLPSLTMAGGEKIYENMIVKCSLLPNTKLFSRTILGQYTHPVNALKKIAVKLLGAGGTVLKKFEIECYFHHQTIDPVDYSSPEDICYNIVYNVKSVMEDSSEIENKKS